MNDTTLRTCPRCDHATQSRCGFCKEILCGCDADGDRSALYKCTFPLASGRMFCGQQCCSAYEVRDAIAPPLLRECVHCAGMLPPKKCGPYCSDLCADQYQTELPLEFYARSNRRG